MIASLVFAALLTLFEWATPGSFGNEIAISAPRADVEADLASAVRDWGMGVGDGEAEIRVVFEAIDYGAASASLRDGECVIRAPEGYEPGPPEFRAEGKDFWYNVLVHEVGHCLGLGHTANWVPSTMGENANRPVTAFDRAVMALLYH